MKKLNHELWVILELLRECNFHCPYCFKNSYQEKIYSWICNKLLNKRGLIQVDINKIASHIKKLDKKCVIRFVGGEPFLFPKFIELCQLLIKDNYIDISTNLSHKKVYGFADKINPEKVKSIQITLHISELEKYGLIEDIIEKIKYLQKKKFEIRIYYVMYPPFFKRFNDDYELFKSHKLRIIPVVFRGVYGLKSYPKAYSKSQKEIIRKFTDETNSKLLELDYNFKGKNCLAGKYLIVVKSDGNVYRCYGCNQFMGNLIDGNVSLSNTAQVCTSNKCLCPEHGLRYVVD